MDQASAATVARRLGGVLEPVIGQVYFSPEAHARYVALGFAPSPGENNGVALPDGPAYFTSRGSLLGQVPGHVVASAFAVFNPDAIIPSVSFGWSLTDAATICDARDQGALETMERVLGAEPDSRDRVEELLQVATEGLSVAGRPLAAGVLAQSMPDHPLGTIWRLGDLLREYRGDSHTVAWVNAGLDAVEIGLLTELYWGLPLRSYTRTRAWTDDHWDRAEAALRERGLLTEAGQFTDQGRQLREQIEVATDAQMLPVLDRLGDGAEELVELLKPWGASLRAANVYPGSGPHDLADMATERAAESSG